MSWPAPSARKSLDGSAISTLIGFSLILRKLPLPPANNSPPIPTCPPWTVISPSTVRPSPKAALRRVSLPLICQLNPPPSNGRVVVGLIDTAVQPLAMILDRFLLKALSVAGDGQFSSDTPTHGTSMAETMLRASR